MNAEQLLAQYERVAYASSAISDLRTFVLELAFRGKLVAQQSEEEPGPVLLQRALERRKELEDSRTIKTASLPYGPLPCGLAEQLPVGWSRSTLGEVCDLQTGATPDTGRKEFFGGDVPWLVSGDINRGEIFECDGRITELALKASNCKLLPKDSVLIALNGQGKTRGTVALLRIRAACNQSLVAIIPIRPDCLSPEYLYLNLKSRYRAIRVLTGGEERRGLNMRLISCVEISIPPLAEQHRIVAKVDELMALCDRLEAARTQREATRDRLTAASLARLNTPEPPASPNGDAPNESAFQADARFALKVLPALTTRPDQIKQLRQTILNLAVRGRLVPQSAADEPASALLQKLIASRERSQSNTRSDEDAEAADPSIDDCELAGGWARASLEDIADIGTGLTPAKSQPKYYEGGNIPWINSGSTSAGIIRKAEHFVTPIAVKECRLKVYPAGSLIVALYGQGKTRGQVAELAINATVNQACAVIQWRHSFESLKGYVFLALRQQYELMRAQAEGGPQPNLNVGKIKRRPMSLPPLAEQKRIVAKVDELMALCDQLEASLTHGENTRSRLLNALLHEALAPADAIPEAA